MALTDLAVRIIFIPAHGSPRSRWTGLDTHHCALFEFNWHFCAFSGVRDP